MVESGMSLSMEFVIQSNNIPAYERVTDEVAKEVVKEMARVAISHMKATVAVDTGTLRRSIKADRPSEHRIRTNEARGADLGSPVPEPEMKDDIATLVVGGTTEYALIQEARVPYIAPALGRVAMEARFIIARAGKKYNKVR